jgi:4-alpha-glucanotransferase
VPLAVAGCPPDIFSPTGQLWGNPLYDWEHHKETGFQWWIQRLKRASTLYDTVRIDHFRGFESYYAIPYGRKTAEIGQWEKGPGMALFDAVKAALGEISIIAEDLGFITPEVRKLLDDSGYPGMKVLQFAFDGDPKSDYLPQNFKNSNCVAYTGTHDNMTLRGWLHSSSSKTIGFAKRYLHCRSASDLPAEILRATWSSTAQLAVAQMQDFLDAGPEGRMNTPSTTGGNWQYRTLTTDFSPRMAKRIYRLNELYNRLPEEETTQAKKKEEASSTMPQLENSAQRRARLRKEHKSEQER